MSSADPGYYGKALYITQFPKYGEYYAEKVKEKNEGSFNLVLCWGLIGHPYAITEVHLFFIVHVIYNLTCRLAWEVMREGVGKKKVLCKACRAQSDFEIVEGLVNYFPVEDGDEVQGDDIGIFEPFNVLPRFVVRYTVAKDPNKVFQPSM